MDLLGSALQLTSLVGRVPTLSVFALRPMFGSVPAAWLKALERSLPPPAAHIFLHNFGSKRVEHIVIKLCGPRPEYPIECDGLPPGKWRLDDKLNEIHVDAIDPGDKASFDIFFERLPEQWVDPKVLVAGRRIGWFSNALGSMFEASTGMRVMLIATLAVFAFIVYLLVHEFSAEHRQRRTVYESYIKSVGMAACAEVITLRASDGQINVAEISRDVFGIKGALAFNVSPDLDELLKRQTVYICARIDR